MRLSNFVFSKETHFLSDSVISLKERERGRILGGSSAINASFYSRADLVFYQKSGLNWDLRVVTESYKWVEKAVVFRPELGN